MPFQVKSASATSTSPSQLADNCGHLRALHGQAFLEYFFAQSVVIFSLSLPVAARRPIPNSAYTCLAIVACQATVPLIIHNFHLASEGLFRTRRAARARARDSARTRVARPGLHQVGLSLYADIYGARSGQGTSCPSKTNRAAGIVSCRTRKPRWQGGTPRVSSCII